jgi:hypothetical protein
MAVEIARPTIAKAPSSFPPPQPLLAEVQAPNGESTRRDTLVGALLAGIRPGRRSIVQLHRTG